MANDSVTLHLDGDVPARLFVEAIAHFNGLIDALAEELTGHELEWIVSDLRPGSATVTFAAKIQEAADIEYAERVAAGYTTVGWALEKGEPIPYSGDILKYADKLTKILDGQITSLRFGTTTQDPTITAQPIEHASQVKDEVEEISAVEGQVQTLASHNGLRFTLYDSFYDQAVTCYADDDKAEVMRDMWGHRAIVEGVVRRDPISGRPTSIRHITAIDILPDTTPGSYRQARGILPHQPGEPAPEERIRRMRDAS